jgi:hypothetical protein
MLPIGEYVMDNPSGRRQAKIIRRQALENFIAADYRRPTAPGHPRPGQSTPISMATGKHC